jgi:hypothetical protein
MSKFVDQIKVRIVLVKLIVLLVILQSLNLDSSYSWIWSWLATFGSQIVAINLFFCFFEKEDEKLFHILGVKQTTFLSRFVIYSGAFSFFLLNKKDVFLSLVF